MAKRPRNYPATMKSPESGRLMKRGEKRVSLTVKGRIFHYLQPGWWCALGDPDDLEGQLVDEDNQVAEMARRTAEAIAEGEVFTPLAIRATRPALRALFAPGGPSDAGKKRDQRSVSRKVAAGD
jgi:hypothetical protein